MNVFLSIDLDYWCDTQQAAHCNTFFKKVYALKLPIHVACEHHQLLQAMDGDFDTLINCDFHSDLCDPPSNGWHKTDLNEGTWGNFVSWRKKGTFIWRYPNTKCLSTGVGYCHDEINPFEKPVSGWKVTKKRRGVYGIPWDSVKAIGVCLSPAWIGPTKVIQEPITRFGLERWLACGGIFANLIPPNVKIINPNQKKQHKSGRIAWHVG